MEWTTRLAPERRVHVAKAWTEEHLSTTGRLLVGDTAWVTRIRCIAFHGREHERWAMLHLDTRGNVVPRPRVERGLNVRVPGEGQRFDEAIGVTGIEVEDGHSNKSGVRQRDSNIHLGAAIACTPPFTHRAKALELICDCVTEAAATACITRRTLWARGACAIACCAVRCRAARRQGLHAQVHLRANSHVELCKAAIETVETHVVRHVGAHRTHQQVKVDDTTSGQ